MVAGRCDTTKAWNNNPVKNVGKVSYFSLILPLIQCRSIPRDLNHTIFSIMMFTNTSITGNYYAYGGGGAHEHFVHTYRVHLLKY